MNYIHYIIVTVAFLLVGGTNADAQTDRNLIRQGNRAFKSQKWAAAETQYRKAISKNQKNPQAIYNLGCALLAQQKDSLAMVQFGNAAQLESNIFRRSKSYHNMGVVMQNHREYAQAIEYYKMALRCNPQDNETRYNLALCKSCSRTTSRIKITRTIRTRIKTIKTRTRRTTRTKIRTGKIRTTKTKISKTRIRTRIILTRTSRIRKNESRQCRTALERCYPARESYEAQDAEGNEPATPKGI